MSGTIEPVLVEGLDQVLLIRLYPEAEALSAAGDMALAQGVETAAAGADAGEQPIRAGAGIEAPEAAAPTRRPPHRRSTSMCRMCSRRRATLTCTMGNWRAASRTATPISGSWMAPTSQVGTQRCPSWRPTSARRQRAS